MDITKYDADIQKAINNFITDINFQVEKLQNKEEKRFLKEKLISINHQLQEIKNAIIK